MNPVGNIAADTKNQRAEKTTLQSGLETGRFIETKT
jgi:hypothetical protein